jgi:glucose/arabinose dehydrogenase
MSMAVRRDEMIRRWLVAVWSVILALTSSFNSDGEPGQPVPGVGTVNAAVQPPAAPQNPLIFQPFLTSGLSSPVLITNAGDGSNRLFVVEQRGEIKIVVNGQILATPFLDVSDLIVSGGEQGLLGLAFHPQFKTNGRFYVFYTAKPLTNPSTDAGDNTLVEYQVSPPSRNVASTTPLRALFNFHDRFGNHNGGNLAFGPDGFLYVGTGDEGSGGDPDNNAQNLGSPYGKMLRIDVDGAPAPGFNYAIPASNPFVGMTGARADIWAYGFRNPWRWSFDRQTGNQMIGDVGQNLFEEIDVSPKGVGGLNFGWRIREGAHCFNPSSNCPTAGLTEPILEYDHGLGCAVIGGVVYRGGAFPSLQGTYVYGDECSGRIWTARLQGGTWVVGDPLDTDFAVSSFGEDEAGELYMVHLGGSVYRVTTSEPTPTATLTITPTVTPSSTTTATVTLTPTVTPTPTTSSGPGPGQAGTMPTLAPTVTPTLPPTATPTPPPVSIPVSRAGANRLAITVTALGSLERIEWTPSPNIAVEDAAGTPISSGQITLPPNTNRTTFYIRRLSGTSATLPLTLTGSFGTWQTFVGGGPDAW